MSIALAILKHYPELSGSQREVIGHLDSPFNRIQTEAKICQECDLRLMRRAEGVIGWTEGAHDAC